MAPRPRGSVSLEITDEDILDKMTEDELWDWYQAGRSRYQVGKEARRRWEKKAVAAAPAEEAPKKAMKTGRPRSVRACADIWALHLCMKKKAASAEEASQSHKKAIQKGMEKAAAPAEGAPWKAMETGRPRSVRACADAWALHLERMKKKAASSEEASQSHEKAIQKGMEKAAAPAEEAHKKAMKKGNKKRAHWKSLKKRAKRAIMRRAPGVGPPENPRQKGTLENRIIKAKFVKRHEHLIPSKPSSSSGMSQSSYLRALWWPKDASWWPKESVWMPKHDSWRCSEGDLAGT